MDTRNLMGSPEPNIIPRGGTFQWIQSSIERFGGEELREQSRQGAKKLIDRELHRLRFRRCYGLLEELQTAHVYLLRKLARWTIDRYGL